MTWRQIKDLFASGILRLSLVLVNAIAFIIIITLFFKSKPILDKISIVELLFSSDWHPLKGHFGFYPFIISTLEVTAIAMILSIPVCLLSAIYLSEYANMRFREFARLAIDILAGIPSVIYGLCGVIVVVPFVRLVGNALGNTTTGYSLLAGGVILAVMVSPFIISLSLEVLRMIPIEARENALALGTTKWEAVRHVILKSARRGIFAAVIMGFARAFGETIAVLMVVGNVAQVPASVFDPAYPLPALIANNYGEMMSIPLYDSAMLLAALILLLVVGGFSLMAHLTLLRMGRQAS
ncbi:MAG: phosphate ABC transporter permease subunit PstC [Syntrophales bacterium]|jgi:phosphate transport system permease protein